MHTLTQLTINARKYNFPFSSPSISPAILKVGHAQLGKSQLKLHHTKPERPLSSLLCWFWNYICISYDFTAGKKYFQFDFPMLLQLWKSGGHQNWHDWIWRNSNYHHAKFQRFLLVSNRENFNVKISAKEGLTIFTFLFMSDKNNTHMKHISIAINQKDTKPSNTTMVCFV